MFVCLSVCLFVRSVVAGDWSAAVHAWLELATSARPVRWLLRTFHARSMSHRFVLTAADAAAAAVCAVDKYCCIPRWALHHCQLSFVSGIANETCKTISRNLFGGFSNPFLSVLIPSPSSASKWPFKFSEGILGALLASTLPSPVGARTTFATISQARSLGIFGEAWGLKRIFGYLAPRERAWWL